MAALPHDTGDQTGGANMIRILVADEHALYRTGLRTILQTALPKAEFLEADSFDALMRSLMEQQPIHLALVSLRLTGSAEPQVIWDFKRASTTTRYVVISSNGSFDQVLHYIAEGFHGFISKLQRDDEIVEAIQEVLAGRLAIPRGLTPFGSVEGYGAREAPSRRSSSQQDPFGLTRRQKDVLALLADGLSNREIAQALHIAEPTAKIHVSALMRTLNVRNRTEAAVLAKDLIRILKLDPTT